jgi:hypothetical protein
MTKILITVFLMMTTTIAAGSLVACSSGASLVRKDAVGGRVQLQGAYMPAMGDARMLMVEHCQGRFEYEEHGDAVEFRCKTTVTRPGTTGQELALRLGSQGQ